MANPTDDDNTYDAPADSFIDASSADSDEAAYRRRGGSGHRPAAHAQARRPSAPAGAHGGGHNRGHGGGHDGRHFRHEHRHERGFFESIGDWCTGLFNWVGSWFGSNQNNNTPTYTERDYVPYGNDGSAPEGEYRPRRREGGQPTENFYSPEEPHDVHAKSGSTGYSHTYETGAKSLFLFDENGNRLVGKDGRPIYSPDMLKEVVSDPEQFAQMTQQSTYKHVSKDKFREISRNIADKIPDLVDPENFTRLLTEKLDLKLNNGVFAGQSTEEIVSQTIKDSEHAACQKTYNDTYTRERLVKMGTDISTLGGSGFNLSKTIGDAFDKAGVPIGMDDGRLHKMYASAADNGVVPESVYNEIVKSTRKEINEKIHEDLSHLESIRPTSTPTVAVVSRDTGKGVPKA